LAPKEVKIDELADFCSSLSRNLMKEHEKRFADRMKSVRETSAGLSNAGARLGVSVKGAWGTMDKQASEYAMRLAQTLEEYSQTISRKDAASSFDDTETFHQDTVKILNEIILTVRRYVPKLHRMLSPEMTALNSSLTRLERSIVSLGAALDESPGLKLEALIRDSQALREKQAELLKLKSEQNAEQALLDAASNRGGELQSKEQELMASQEFSELVRYEESLKHKEEEIRQLLHPLVKPLIKLERAVAAKQGPSIDVNALRNLLDSPIETVVTGQRFAWMQLFGALEQTLEAGNMEIPEKKRRKAEEAIRSVKEGALDRAREEYLALQANTQETLRQLKSKGLLDVRDKLEKELTNTRSEIQTIETRQMELKRRIGEVENSLFKLKISVESQVDKISRQPITIITE
jgi:hypothetical protein